MSNEFLAFNVKPIDTISMKKISLLLLLALSVSCTTQRMKLAFDEDLDPEKFDDKLNSHEVEFAQAIYHNDAQKAAAIVNSASKRKNIDINKYVDLRRCNKNKSFSFLLFAALQECPAIIELILDNTWGESNTQGRDIINQQTRGTQRTALHVAAERDYEEVVKILLAKDADVHATTIKGETPLHLALDSSYVAIAEVLLAKGADVHATTTAGKTPLHLAAERNYVRVAETLLKKGANVRVETRAGKTPLHLAAENNCKEAVLCLLSNQANRQATDHQGKTPLALAQSAQHEEIVKILKPIEKKSRRRSCINCAAACDQHFTGCPTISALGFTLDCACFQKPCSFTCKSLCCIWCHPLKEEAPHPTPSSSTAPPTPIEQPVRGE